MRAIGVMIVAALGGVGCGAAVPPVPGNGGPAWSELTSEHFTVWTDADLPQARELVRVMEHLRQVVVGVAFPSVPAAGRTLVIALRDDVELSAFARTGWTRAFAAPAYAPLWQPMIVLSAFSNVRGSDLTVAHELTHVISFAIIHHQPRWLTEGMAEFFETVALDPSSTTADVGAAPSNRGQPQRMAHLIPVASLLQWKSLAYEYSQYSTAWALFTFLMNKHRSELVQYMQVAERANQREPTTPADAERMWNEAFPSLPLGEVDVELRQWLLSGSHLVLHFRVEPRRWPIAERTLGDADAYAIRAMLRFRIGREEQARADVYAALDAEPTNVLARLLTVAYDKAAVTVDQARAAQAAHPGDWRAWWLEVIAVGDAHGEEADAEAARARACSLIAHNRALVAPPGLCPPTAPSPDAP